MSSTRRNFLKTLGSATLLSGAANNAAGSRPLPPNPEIQKPKEPFRWEHDAYGTNYQDCGLTGYTGLDYNTVAQLSVMPAERAQVGRRGFYKAGLAELPNGDLIASPVNMLEPMVNSPFPTGTPAVMARNWPVRLHKSTDKGRTWKPIEHTPLVGKEGSLTCLRNGALLFTGESLDGVGCSEDGGHIWNLTGFNTPHEKDQYVAIVRGPIQQPDGTLSFLRCTGIMEGYTEPAPRCRAWLHHSKDYGKTWSDREAIEVWDDPFTLFAEADFLTLPDGRLLATSRFEWDHPIKGTQPPYPPGSMPNDHAAGHMVLLESTDGGRHWTPPRDFLNYSEVQGQLTLLKDGRLLCTYTHYHLPFGVAAVMSYDYGKTWDFAHPFQLAISNAVSTGWGTTRQLQDGSLLTIYALEPYHLEPKEKGRTVCHTVRWNAPPPRPRRKATVRGSALR